MNHKPLFLATALIALLVIAGAFWMMQKRQAVIHPPVTTEPVVEPVTQTEPANPIDTSDWKTYRNDTLKLSVKYPTAFKVDSESTDIGCVVMFMEFDGDAKDLTGQKIPGYFLVISINRWEDINNPELKGGSWEEEKKYENFEDFLADSEHTYINVTGETTIDGTKAYILSMPGEMGYEAIMFEYNGGYYRISFPWVQKQLDENIKKQFLSSIRLVR
ncbi:MAG: hypothetical protein IPJ68_03140 [Candidatus Moraniibacteriota bacterium]|nr:MAG: hypothetical protein IPJ68_03140 [Candidatus Moranbacteria bacterium]